MARKRAKSARSKRSPIGERERTAEEHAGAAHFIRDPGDRLADLGMAPDLPTIAVSPSEYFSLRTHALKEIDEKLQDLRDWLDHPINLAERSARLTRLAVAGLLAEDQQADQGDLHILLDCADLAWARACTAEALLRKTGRKPASVSAGAVAGEPA
jgi:hypothetical protein